VEAPLIDAENLFRQPGPALSRIERERENPPPDRLVSALARALGQPADSLFAAARRLPPDLRARTEDVIAVYRQQNAGRGR